MKLSPLLQSKWTRLFPPASWLADYRLAWLPSDAIAGITLAAYAIPVSLAYAGLAGLPPQVVARDGTVGVRVPDHSVALTLCARAGGALAATSANRSGEAPACSAGDIVSQLEGGIDVVLDGAELTGGRLRPGFRRLHPGLQLCRPPDSRHSHRPLEP